MRSAAIRVPREEGEAVRRILVARGALRKDLRILATPGRIIFPVREPIPEEIPGERGTEEFPPLSAGASAARYQDLVAVEEPLRRLLPRSYDVIGDIVLLRIPSPLLPYRFAIGEALLSFVPGARIVGADRGVHGPDRIRRIERIAGSGPWRTHHKENGVTITVDVERAYFSPRLAREHDRVAVQVTDNERVFDLCCGVGPFSLAIAARGRAREICAVDRNPEAIRCLAASLEHARGGSRVHAVRGEIAEFLGAAGRADRAILNLPHEGVMYLSSVADAVDRDGTIHFYEIVPRSASAQRGAELVRRISRRGGTWSLRSFRTVHPYSAQQDLVAYDLHRSDRD
ncbi:MAG: class I SAM-dependent methyltransferase family protein [Thermoplasmata archaeon]